MNDLVQKLKIPAIVIVVIIIGFFVYETYFSQSSSTTDLQVSTSQTSAQDQDFLNLLLQIKNINLDTSIFQNSAFISLQDDTLPILDQPYGRPNPFAPIGQDSGSISTSTLSTSSTTNTQ